MKRLLFVLFIIPFLTFAQKQKIDTLDNFHNSIEVKNDTLFLTNLSFKKNKSISKCLGAGGALLAAGTLSNIISSGMKFVPARYNDPVAGLDSFNRTQRSFSLIGWSAIGVSSIFFISAAVLYSQQNNIRYNIDNKIVVIIVPAGVKLEF